MLLIEKTSIQKVNVKMSQHTKRRHLEEWSYRSPHH